MKKLTHKQYIEKLWDNNEYYRKGDFEVSGLYTGGRNKLLIKDKYGECLVNPNNLLKGSKPSIQTSIDKTKYFIEKAKLVHGDKYDYSLVDYKSSEKSKIVITCKEHGNFEQTAHAHLCSQGCEECKRYSRLDGRRLTTEDFIEKADKVHNNLYLYTKSEVKGNKNKVIITCKKHGDFEQSPNSHLKGRGCRKCYLENNGYNKGKFIYFAKNNLCRLYLIEVYNEKERFLKIGITSKSVNIRFSGNRKLPYEYNIILEIKFEDAGYVWEEEVKLKQNFKKHKYKPKLNFKGYTECFNIEQKENIINYLKIL